MSEVRKFPQYLSSVVSSIGALMTGLALGWSGPVEDEVRGGLLGFLVTENEFSWVAGILPLGAAVGCIPSGLMISIIGRKTMLCILPVIFLIGWLVIQYSVNSWMLCAGRAIIGIACGAVCTTTPIYIGEIAQKEIRGKCGNFFQLLISIGSSLIYLIGAFLTIAPTNYFCVIICFIQFVSMIFMPESPTYLLEKDKEMDAEEALAFLRGKNYDIKSELNDTKSDILERRKARAERSFFASFNNIACFRALYMALGLMFFQQFSGINTVIFYSVSIFDEAGSSVEPRFSAFIIVSIGFVTTLISGFFVDRFGRRVLLLFSSGFMAASAFIFGLYFHFHDNNLESVQDLGWLPLLALCTFTIMFSLGYGPVPWIMVGELFGADVRGPASSIAATSNWLFAFIVSKSYVSVKNVIGVGITFWIFSIVSVIGIFFVLFLLPETKGKSLQEIQDILSVKKESSKP